MPSARYWRLSALSPNAGSLLSLSELGLYEAGVRVDTGAMLTATIAPSTGAISALSDGSNATTCSWSSEAYSLPGFGFVYDLGTAKNVEEIRVGAGSAQSEFLYSMDVQASDDGASWSTTYRLFGIDWPGASGTTNLVNFDQPGTVFGFDGADGATTSTTYGIKSLAMEFMGAAALTTAYKKFGTAALALTGAAGTYVRVQPGTVNKVFYPGTGDFSIGCQLRYVGGTGTFNGVWAFGELDPIRLRVNPDLTLSLEISGAGIVISGASGLNSTDFKHVLVQRVAGVIRLFVDGVKVGSDYSSSANLSSNSIFYIGCARGDSWFFKGTIDEVEISDSGALYNHAGFTPPTSRRVQGGSSQALLINKMALQPSLVWFPSPYTPPMPISGVPQTHTIKHQRRDFQGHGRIVGTVKEKALPSNAPLRRHVYCMDALTSTIVADLWSDATTGAYVFNDLDLTRRYTVFSYDHTNAYRAVIADNLQPELMP